MGALIIKTAQAALKLLLLPFTFLAALAKKFFAGRLPKWMAILIEAVTVLIVVSGLAAINWYFGLDRHLTGPPQLRKIWLGLIALLAYVTIRLSLIVLKHLPQRVPEFPDIADAFTAATEALADARIDIRDAPLFLVLGTDASSEQALATDGCFGTHLYGADINAPLRVYTNSEGIWLTLPGISAISAQAMLHNKCQLPKKSPLRLGAAEKEQAAARLRFFIQLVRHARGAIVPANGVILTVPYSWMQDEQLGSMSDTVQIDMEVLQESLGVKCLCQIVFRDIEQSSEFAAFIERMSETARLDALGCTLPHFSVIGADDIVPLHEWLQSQLQHNVFAAFQENLAQPTNGNLYRLLDTFERGMSGFCNVLGNAFAVDVENRFYLGGVYFASLKSEQNAFVNGVIGQMVNDHDEMIAWNDRTRRSENRYRRWSALAAAGVVLLLTCDLLIVGALMLSRNQG